MTNQDYRALIEQSSATDIHNTLTWAFGQDIKSHAVTYEMLVLYDSDLDNLLEALMLDTDYPAFLDTALSVPVHPSAWAAVGRTVSKHINILHSQTLTPTSYDWALLEQCIENMKVDDLARSALTFSSHPRVIGLMLTQVFDKGSPTDVEEMVNRLDAVLSSSINNSADEPYTVEVIDEISAHKNNPQYGWLAHMVFHSLELEEGIDCHAASTIQKIFNDIDYIVVDRLIDQQSALAQRLDVMLPHLNINTQRCIAHHPMMSEMRHSSSLITHERLTQEVGTMGQVAAKPKL